MNITILTDNPNSWILPHVEDLKKELKDHDVTHLYSAENIRGGDLMLVLSCEKILPQKYLQLFRSSIVVHSSKVPLGKGWSPLAWQVEQGCKNIPISLFEALEKVDSGNVYLVDYIKLNGNELNEEIKHLQGLITVKMVKEYVSRFPMKGVPQKGEETFYKKRKKANSQLDIDKTIAEQFNLLRVVDNERYPAHFYKNGEEYIVKIYKA